MENITKWRINIPYLLTLELQSAAQLRHNLLSDLIVKGVRPWVIDAALECAATATKCFHSALQCVFRKLLKNIKMVVFIFSESELLITDWKIVSSNPYLSIFPSKIPLFLSKFLAGAL